MSLAVSIVDERMSLTLQDLLDSGESRPQEAIKHLTEIHYPGEDDRLAFKVARILQRKNESVSEYYSRFNRYVMMLRILKGFPSESELPCKFIVGRALNVK